MSVSIENQRALDTIIEGLIKRIGQVDGGNDVLQYVVVRLVSETTDKNEIERLSNGADVLLAVCDELRCRLLTGYEKAKSASLHQPPPITEALTDKQIAAAEACHITVKSLPLSAKAQEGISRGLAAAEAERDEAQ